MKMHPDLRKPEVLAYLAQLLAWKEGDPTPQRPAQLTMSDAELGQALQDRDTRRQIALRLSVLVPDPNRKLRRRASR